MNPQWNTPPNGDFAKYVERLSAQAALPRQEPRPGEHGLDVGMTPSSEPHGSATDVAAALRRSTQSNGEAQLPTGSAWAHKLFKGMAIAWMAVLVLLWLFKAPFALVAAIFAFGLWLAHRLRRWALPPGVANWRQWIEAEALKQKLRQQQQRRSK